MATVNVRYMVDDVEAAVAFYTTHLGFALVSSAAPAFADVTVGTILRCHLVVEHFLDEYLAAANPGISDLASVRLTFAQKLALADNSRTLFALIMPALRALNRVRNQLAHRLDAADLEAILQPIQDFVTMWRTAGRYDVPKGLHAVQDFTLIASGFMHGATRTIERHGQGRGLIGMLEWYADEQQPGVDS